MSNIYESIKYFRATDGTDIEYSDLGGDDPVLLFIPGYSLATDLVLPALSKMRNHFRVITLTLRGFGGSNPQKAKGTEARGEISIDQAARDLKELMEHLSLENCILVGYSMGTHVAFSYIEQFGCQGISRLAILDMTPKLVNDQNWDLGLYQGHYTKERALKDLEIMEKDYIKGFNEYFFHQAALPHTRDESRDYVFTEKMKSDTDEYAKWYNIPGLTSDVLTFVDSKKWHLYSIYWKDMCNRDFRPMLKDITIPTGIFYAVPGSIYDTKTAEYLKENIYNSKLYPIPNAVHTSMTTWSTMDMLNQLNLFIKDFE